MGPRGDPGVGIQGPPGPPGRYMGLTQEDIDRIVSDPRIKVCFTVNLIWNVRMKLNLGISGSTTEFLG